MDTDEAITKTIDIWTVQLSKWRAVKNKGIYLLDITVKSGIQAFAPEPRVLWDYKAGLVTKEQYTELYLEKVRFGKEDKPEQWEVLKKHPRVALACYCRADSFCHRHLFLPLMEEYLVQNNIAPNYMGEIR